MSSCIHAFMISVLDKKYKSLPALTLASVIRPYVRDTALAPSLSVPHVSVVWPCTSTHPNVAPTPKHLFTA